MDKSKSKDKAKSSQPSQKEEEKSQSSQFIENLKKKAVVHGHGIDNVSTFEHPSSFMSSQKKQDQFTIKSFIDNCDFDILKIDDEEIIFDLIGVEPPLANALRRIMIAEIPTMAIEKVNMWQNTSILADENLAHRIGLVPINVDPRLFEYHEKKETGETHTELDSIKFKLHVQCRKKDPSAPMVLNNTVDEETLYENANVYSSHLKWVPIGDQKQRFGEIRPLFEDVLIAKLRPGQEIEMELICEKGIGKTHAKWSPVSTAYYRLVPDIKIKEDIKNEEATELKNLCPMGVFDIEDLGKKGSKKFIVCNIFIERAIVGDSRKCTTCRECIRHDKFKDRIEVGKIKDRFEFHVESVGMYKPQDIFIEALKKLKEKANFWIDVLEQEGEKDEQDLDSPKKNK